MVAVFMGVDDIFDREVLILHQFSQGFTVEAWVNDCRFFAVFICNDVGEVVALLFYLFKVHAQHEDKILQLVS